MSIETLKTDLKTNVQALMMLDPVTTTTAEIVQHLKDTLWPFLESVVDETAEIDECVADIISGAEDILQPETAEVFAAIIAGAVAVSAALKARLEREPADETVVALKKICAELEKNCKSGEAIMQEIVIDTGEDDDADDDDDDDLADDETEGAAQ